MKSRTIADVARECFGQKADRLLARGAVHPILDRKNRKAPYVRGVQHGYFDLACVEWEAVGLQAGPLSELQVLDIDHPDLVPAGFEPNVITTRGAHFYGVWDGGRYEQVREKVEIIRRSNVVFYDDRAKDFRHPRVLDLPSFAEVVEAVRRR